MPGGVSCGEQVGELTVGFQVVHSLEVEHLDNGKVFVKFLSVFCSLLKVRRIRNLSGCVGRVLA